MAKYVIELNDEELKNLNYFINLETGDIVDYSKLYALQKSLPNIKPLSHLDLQQELYDIQHASIQSFQATTLQDKIKDWLLKNKAHAHRDPLADGYRVIVNDNDGTKVMFISNEHIIDNPMDVVQKVTDLLQGSTFFQSWDDDDEKTVPKYNLTNNNSSNNNPGSSGGFTLRGHSPNSAGGYPLSSGYSPVSVKPSDDHWAPWNSEHGTLPQKTNQDYCFHEWKQYTGLNETFKYCTKCDKKNI